MEGDRDYITHLEGGEKRLTNRLKQCWANAVPGSGIPSLDAILTQYVGDLWEYFFVLEAMPDGQFVFQEIGSVFHNELGCNLLGSLISEVPLGTLLFQCTRNIDVVLAKKRPAFFAGEFVNLDEQESLYRSCLLPVSISAGANISALGAGWCRTEQLFF